MFGGAATSFGFDGGKYYPIANAKSMTEHAEALAVYFRLFGYNALFVVPGLYVIYFFPVNSVPATDVWKTV